MSRFSIEFYREPIKITKNRYFCHLRKAFLKHFCNFCQKSGFWGPTNLEQAFLAVFRQHFLVYFRAKKVENRGKKNAFFELACKKRHFLAVLKGQTKSKNPKKPQGSPTPNSSKNSFRILRGQPLGFRRCFWRVVRGLSKLFRDSA